jgi:hypothetical protein
VGCWERLHRLDERGRRANDVSGLMTYNCSLLQSRVERENGLAVSRRQVVLRW